MSFPLFKSTLKRNWMLLIIFFMVLLLYSVEMISMYNPESMKQFDEMLELLPKGLIDAMGFGKVAGDLSGYIASTLYGMIMLVFPMIYCIILGGRLVARPVDSGYMAYYLSTPNSRTKIIMTQGIYAILSIIVLFAVTFVSTVAACNLMFPGKLVVSQYINVVLITLLVNLSVMMICFFFSCLFSDATKAIGFGSAVPIGFFLMTMIANASDKLKDLNNYSIYGLYDPTTIAHDGIPTGLMVFYIGLIVVLFTASILVFRKKNLSI